MILKINSKYCLIILNYKNAVFFLTPQILINLKKNKNENFIVSHIRLRANKLSIC